MEHQRTMRRFAQWHIWLGWLVGVPVLMWTVTGLFMVAKPIEEVRGNHLRKEIAAEPMAGNPRSVSLLIEGPPVREFRSFAENGRGITLVTYMDGRVERYSSETGMALEPVDEREARAIVARSIVGGDTVTTALRFNADDVPFDFRRPMPVWQVALEDGTHIYVGAETGQIEAIRTRWWRAFDFMWGLHIMDLQAREDTHHPILIFFAALSVIGALLGCILMVRRRKARITAS